MNKLELCPGCQSPAKIFFEHTEGENACVGCVGTGDGLCFRVYGYTTREAVERWNSRGKSTKQEVKVKEQGIVHPEKTLEEQVECINRFGYPLEEYVLVDDKQYVHKSVKRK